MENYGFSLALPKYCPVSLGCKILPDLCWLARFTAIPCGKDSGCSDKVIFLVLHYLTIVLYSNTLWKRFWLLWRDEFSLA